MTSDSPGFEVPPPAAPAPTLGERLVALIEVILCSDYPTQLALVATFQALGFSQQQPDKTLDIFFVATVSLVDSVLLIGLILTFLYAHGESPRAVFFGGRPMWSEARAGIPLIFIAFIIALGVILLARTVAPWLRTVEHNPLQDLMTTRREAVLFAVVVVVAGGIREELQRAFLLRRFERWLGGPGVGIAVTSVAFVAGHNVQGADAVLATTLLGPFWGIVYLRRRSVVAPMVSHSGFDLWQVLQFFTMRR